MPALATVAGRPDLAAGSRVPVEWIGRARLLRQRVAEAHSEWEKACDALVTPLCHRDGFAPTFTKGSLRLLAARWRHLPERWGRLRLVAQNDGERLSVAEFRLVDFRQHMAGWSEDELSIAVAVVTVTMALPSTFTLETRTLAIVGLHALARRYARGADRRDIAVVRDLLPLAVAVPAALAKGGDFEIPASDGRWIGARMTLDGKPVAAVRTFVAS